jgi:predicted phage-related endonuclease
VRTFQIIDVPQRSPEWWAARLARLTGSAAPAMLAAGKGITRGNLIAKFVAETITRIPQDEGNTFTTAPMEHGKATEPEALGAYEVATGNLVQSTGFLAHLDHMAGCSLDGHVGDFEGIVELKCPNTTTHLGYLSAGRVPPAYIPQITHNLWITGAEWCDFVSYDPRLLEPYASRRLLIVRVKAKDLDIAGYEQKALAFLREVDAAVASLVPVGDALRACVSQIEGAA